VLGLQLLPDRFPRPAGVWDFAGETANLVRLDDPSSTITYRVLRGSGKLIVIGQTEPFPHYMLDSGITAV
jgi:hypothetical protein